MQQLLYNSFKTFNPPCGDALLTSVSSELSSIIRNSLTPSNTFNVFSVGSFKEAYDEIPDVVFKFCSTANNTPAERYIYEQAREENLEMFFLPTIFIPLPNYLTSTILADAEEPEELDYLEIQPRARVLKELDSYVFTRRRWKNDLMENYGADKYVKFLNFCEDYNIFDLSNANVGYWKGQPIILDWLSGS